MNDNDEMFSDLCSFHIILLINGGSVFIHNEKQLELHRYHNAIDRERARLIIFIFV